MEKPRILLGGHRGDRAHYPENTMPAMQAMARMGADAIETDVRMTRDGELVLIHDRDVARTTNGQGFVDQMTLEEIRALDAGSWKDPAFAGERIPTVKEFVAFVSQTDLWVNWELKEYPTELGDRAYTCIDKLVELIDQYGLAERSLMNSFSWKALEYVNAKWPGKFAIHGYPGYDKVDRPETDLEDRLQWAVVWKKDPEHLEGFQSDYEAAKAKKQSTCILVPDKPSHYQKAIDMGCVMFTSDDPQLALDILKNLGYR